MPHAPSIVRTYQPLSEKPTMPRTAKPIDPKTLKLEIKDAKAAMAAAKKNVSDAMSAFLTDNALAKEYRAAVSEHIAAVKVVTSLEAKLATAS